MTAIKPKKARVTLKEPQRYPGACWTGLAIVLAAGSATLNVTGWVADADWAAPVGAALSGTIVTVCLVSEGGQLLALYKSEQAFKARPRPLIGKGATLIGIGILCGCWNMYSATRAIEALNRHNESLYWAEYKAKPNELARLISAQDLNNRAVAELSEDDSPYWATLKAQEASLALIPAEHSTNRNKAVATMLATQDQVQDWLASERSRFAGLAADLKRDISAETERVQKLASAKNIPFAQEIGLSAAIELFKLIMLWAGATAVARKVKLSKKDKAEIQFNKAFKRMPKISNVIPWRKKA